MFNKYKPDPHAILLDYKSRNKTVITFVLSYEKAATQPGLPCVYVDLVLSTSTLPAGIVVHRTVNVSWQTSDTDSYYNDDLSSSAEVFSRTKSSSTAAIVTSVSFYFVLSECLG